MKPFKKYLLSEINIEFKACLYFFAFLFFFCCYRIWLGEYTFSILHMTELILATYLMGYVQVFFLRNFDEEDQFTVFTIGCAIGCSLIYSLLAYVLGWCSGNLLLCFFFFLYSILCYICAQLVYKFRRDLETEKLNLELESFKANLSDEEA